MNRVVLVTIIVILVTILFLFLKPQITGNVIFKNDTSPAPLRTTLYASEPPQEIVFGDRRFFVSIDFLISTKTKLKITDDAGNEIITDSLLEEDSWHIGNGVIFRIDDILVRDVVGGRRQVSISIWNKDAFLCYDTDNGLMPNIKGRLLLNGGVKVKQDHCWPSFRFNDFFRSADYSEPSDVLAEYYCYNNAPRSVKIYCRCEDGRCVEEQSEGIS